MATARTIHRLTGTGQTVGAVTADLCTYTVPTNTSVLAVGYSVGKDGTDSVGVQSSGAAQRIGGGAVVVGSAVNLLGVAGATLTGATAAVVVSGNDVILRATGVALKTIDWFGELHLWIN